MLRSRYILTFFLLSMLGGQAGAQVAMHLSEIPLECRVLTSLKQPMPKACKRVVKEIPDMADNLSSIVRDQTPTQDGAKKTAYTSPTQPSTSRQMRMYQPGRLGDANSIALGGASVAAPLWQQDLPSATSSHLVRSVRLALGKPSAEVVRSALIGQATMQRSSLLDRILAAELPPGLAPEVHQSDVSGPIFLVFERATVLTAESKIQLDLLSRAIMTESLQPLCILLEGHTDSVGSDIKNLSMSRKRAERVRDLLIGQIGTESYRFIVRGAGESRPIDGFEPQDPRNRRVEVYARAGFEACV